MMTKRDRLALALTIQHERPKQQTGRGSGDPQRIELPDPVIIQVVHEQGGSFCEEIKSIADRIHNYVTVQVNWIVQQEKADQDHEGDQTGNGHTLKDEKPGGRGPWSFLKHQQQG